ncbi:MAG: nucleoside-diphosphate-sugar epimerase [Motiliproteus sp.]|jgi:nucleoside-diphosphate-sugar epimerase
MKLASLSKKRVLVTGASGFTGFHLLRRLDALECSTLSLVHHSTAGKNERVADICDTAQLTATIAEFRPDFVVHLAAISFVGHGNSLDFYRTNVLGTQSLLDALVAANIGSPRILIASSANVYGNQQKELIVETDSCAPVNHYAISKLATEMVAATFFDTLDIIITRPFNYTGLHQKDSFLIPKIVTHFARRAEEISLGNLDVARDFSGIDFVIEAYIRLLEADISSEIVNICSGRLISLASIIQMLEPISNHKIDIKVNPLLVRNPEIKKMSGSNVKLFAITGDIPIEPFETVLRSLYSAAVANEKTHASEHA